MKMKVKAASKEVKTTKPKALNATPRKPQIQKSNQAHPKPFIHPVESEGESASDLENELLEEEAHNDLVDDSSEDDDELLEGFESDSNTEENAKPLNLPPVPPTNRERKQAKKAAKAASAEKSSLAPKAPGIIYLGHIPRGFFEPQMHAYFSQFGTVTRLRLARNRRTGKSKHFAYVEFVSRDVAEIVAETMDGYLIPPHRLVCKVVEDVDERVWKGANSVFKKIPWSRVNRQRLEGKKSKGKWEELVKRDEERAVRRAEKIKAVGIEYEFPSRGKKRKIVEVLQETAVEKKGSKTEKGNRKVSGRT